MICSLLPRFRRYLAVLRQRSGCWLEEGLEEREMVSSTCQVRCVLSGQQKSLQGWFLIKCSSWWAWIFFFFFFFGLFVCFCAVGTAEYCHWFFKALRLGLWSCFSHSIFCCLRPVLMIASLKWKTHPVSFCLLKCFLHFMLLAALQNVCVRVYFTVYNYCVLESSSNRGFSAVTLFLCL